MESATCFGIVITKEKSGHFESKMKMGDGFVCKATDARTSVEGLLKHHARLLIAESMNNLQRNSKP